MVFAYPPKGLIIDLITPLDKSGEIDGRSLGKQIDRMLPHAHALLIGSPLTGEGGNLSIDQRGDLFEKALVVVRGRVPILMWVSNDTEEKMRDTLVMLERMKEKRRYSGPVIWVDTPLYYHSNRGLLQHYQGLASLSENPILLHNAPDLVDSPAKPLKRNNIRTSILKELIHLPAVQGLIFSGSFERVYHYQKATRSRAEFRIYDGNESHFLHHPSLSGVISRGANLVPHTWKKITASSLNLNENWGDYPDFQRQVWEGGLYLDKLIELYQEGGRAVVIIKKALTEMGIIESSTSTLPKVDIESSFHTLKALLEQAEDYQ